MNAPRPIAVSINVILLATFAGGAAAQTVPSMIYVPITPCRVVDTRITGGPLAAKEIRTFSTNGAATQGGGACTVYVGATPAALSLNVTVDATSLGDPNKSGALFLWGDSATSSSWMNYYGEEVIANAGVAGISVEGDFSIKTQNPANVIVDVSGYFISSAVVPGSGDVGSIVGAGPNVASGSWSTALGHVANATGSVSTAIGNYATASGFSSTAMGYETVASGPYSFAVGNHTTASGPTYSSTAMGNTTVASGDDSTAMGSGAKASGTASTAMGFNTLASGEASTAMGFDTTASGDRSIALGDSASTNNFLGAFVYGDGSAVTANSITRQFLVRASGGVKFYTSSSTAGAELAQGSGTWTDLSDRNAKDAIEPIDNSTVLDRVVAMPLGTWHYKAQDTKFRHMGPMAQDFYAAFHLGESDIGIDTIDADGVALAAIQGLNAKLISERDEKEKEIASLRMELVAQEARVASLESLAGDLAEMKRELATLKRDP